MAFLTPNDLATFAEVDPAKAAGMIDDASALAVLAAPCLGNEDDLTDQQLAQVKAILRGAILRWNDGGTGAVQSETAGPFSKTYASAEKRSGLFFPAEIEQLRTICRAVDGGGGGAFSIDTAPCLADVHADTCALRFGATYCSCGVDIAGFPLYETP